MPSLTNCGKMEVRNSPIEGYGVFATEDIPANTILEEVPFILFPRHTFKLSRASYEMLGNIGLLCEKEKYLENLRTNLGFKDPEKYYFYWHPKAEMDKDSKYVVLPLGFGPIYNSSNTNNNADWKIADKTFIFRTEKDIKKDEEIRTFYGYFLTEVGQTYNCDLVFFLAIDNLPDSPDHRIKALRFGDADQFQRATNDPYYKKIAEFLAASQDGLILKCLALASSEGAEVAKFIFPDNPPLSLLYGKLAEFHMHPAPILVGFIEFFNKTDGKKVEEKIFLRK